ncbi:MAG: Gfo/Idh/MocA family oxidoreductase [Armatimonadetes bacterium]|nr:Gfo/Idh/MocA family oxidoreductase [Armatimonadota bacterium]
METVTVGLLGAGGIIKGCHLPGLRRIPGVRLLAVADPAPGKAQEIADSAGIPHAFTEPERLMEMEDLDAVVIATPNIAHPPLVHAAAERKLHVLSEKPLALDPGTADRMVVAAEAAGIVHMTAFTYRFVPSMRWMAHRIANGEIGAPHHFRSQRFQDYGDKHRGWRMVKEICGSGELADMMSHRIDYSHMLIGPMAGLFGKVKNLLPERRGEDGSPLPSDVDDWAALIVEFESGCTGVFESSKGVAGYGQGLKSHDFVEVNGTDGSLKYYLHQPTTLWYAKPNGMYEAQPVPEEFLKLPGSPRDPREGDPGQTFRWDQAWEFISAIRENRPASPSLADGARVQAVLDAALRSSEEGRWISF